MYLCTLWESYSEQGDDNVWSMSSFLPLLLSSPPTIYDANLKHLKISSQFPPQIQLSFFSSFKYALCIPFFCFLLFLHQKKRESHVSLSLILPRIFGSTLSFSEVERGLGRNMRKRLRELEEQVGLVSVAIILMSWSLNHFLNFSWFFFKTRKMEKRKRGMDW